MSERSTIILFDDYQKEAFRTMNMDLSHKEMLLSCALGLGEAGEVQNLVKKTFFHGHDIDVDKILNELGDVQWYVSVMAKLLGYPSSHVASLNIQKLSTRYPDKFSPHHSINRKV